MVDDLRKADIVGVNNAVGSFIETHTTYVFFHKAVGIKNHKRWPKNMEKQMMGIILNAKTKPIGGRYDRGGFC